MGGLNLYTEDESGAVSEKKKRSRSPKVILGLCVLLAIPVVGTTFASTVTVNAGANVDFGQGKAGALACDPQVVITPGAIFTGGVWELETITIGGINTSNTLNSGDNSPGCQGDNISVSAYDGSNAIISGTTFSFTVPASGTSGSNASGATITLTHGQNQNDTATAVLASPVTLDSGHNVSGFTIQQN